MVAAVGWNVLEGGGGEYNLSALKIPLDEAASLRIAFS
jgi:hypothetical protein